MELTRSENRLVELACQQKQGRSVHRYSIVLAFSQVCAACAACFWLVVLGTPHLAQTLPVRPVFQAAMFILAGIFLVAGVHEFLTARFRKNALALIAKLSSELQETRASGTSVGESLQT